MGDMFKDEFTLVLNSENKLIKAVKTVDDDTRKTLCEHIYDLAMLCHKPLSPEQMTKFIERSNKLMEKLI